MENIKQFNNFLNKLKEDEPALIETIQKAFSMLFESTEDVVERAKEKVVQPEEIPVKGKNLASEVSLDDLTEKPEEEPDISEFLDD